MGWRGCFVVAWLDWLSWLLLVVMLCVICVAELGWLRLLLWFWVCVGIGWWFYGYLVGVLGFVRCVSFW